MSKDYTEMSVEEAVKTVLTQYKFDNTRKRIKSKAIAWILCNALREAVQYIENLENKIKELATKDGSEKTIVYPK